MQSETNISEKIQKNVNRIIELLNNLEKLKKQEPSEALIMQKWNYENELELCYYQNNILSLLNFDIVLLKQERENLRQEIKDTEIQISTLIKKGDDLNDEDFTSLSIKLEIIPIIKGKFSFLSWLLTGSLC